MANKDPSEQKKKYHMFRHHAWAGLGFLSVLLAIRLIYPSLAGYLAPIIIIILVYIIICLLFTYRFYRAGLSAKDEIIKVSPSVEIEKTKINAEVEKERLKLEKKRVKADAKKKKKSSKK